MKSVGQVIRDARIKKKLSFERLASLTKIKKDFLEAIEKEEWASLPEYPVVTGFVKNISQALNIDVKGGVALLRRDYPPKKLSINPKPDVSREFVWSPKLTFIVGIAGVAVLILGYLTFQYVSFISPPKLSVGSPYEGQKITGLKVAVSGDTDSEATIKVNNQPVIADQNGRFSTEIEISEETKDISVVAKSRSGKETTLVRRISVELK